MLFTGDLNCDREQLVHVEQLLNEFHWTDLGASADMWGEAPSENTCFFDENSTGTRNDYMFANPHMIPYIQCFKVVHDLNFRTHRVLQLKINADYAGHHLVLNKVPPSLEGKLRSVFEGKYLGTITTEDSKQVEELRLTKDYRSHWTIFLSSFHDAVISEACLVEGSYRAYLEAGETNMAWRLWCKMLEDSFAKFLELSLADKVLHTGRGKPHFSSKVVGTSHETIDFDTNTKSLVHANTNHAT